MAKGADKAIHIEVDQNVANTLEPMHVAKALAKIAKDEKFDAVFVGKQAIDDDANQTGQLIAGLLDWPQATFASKVEVDGGHFKVTREIDGGLDTVKVKLPAVVSADLRLNEPRYAPLPMIMKARKKPIDKKTPKDLGLDFTPQTETLEVSFGSLGIYIIYSFQVTEPPARKAGEFVEDVPTLISKLRERGAIPQILKMCLGYSEE